MSDQALPPPFSSLTFSQSSSSSLLQPKEESLEYQLQDTPAVAPAPPFDLYSSSSAVEAEVEPAKPRDLQKPSSSKDQDEAEPPPPYTEGPSPLNSFTYVMSAAGGAASILTQVSQSAGQPLNQLASMLPSSTASSTLTTFPQMLDQMKISL